MEKNDNYIDSENSFDFCESEDKLNINDKSNEIPTIIDTVNQNESLTSNNSLKDDKKIYREELIQKKQYYKLLLVDYKKFLKKINFFSSATDTTYDLSSKTRTFDKTKNYNMRDTHLNLYKNIKNIKKDLFYINKNFNDNILILDGENILKSNKYQQLIKLHLTNLECEHYFSYWHNGGENGLVQPMTSLNLLVDDKIFLMEILIKNYLSLSNCIVIVSGKSNIDNTKQRILVNDNKTMIIPVLYDKSDIREQDDHLMLYIYYHYHKIKNCEIISGDKFKWFNHTEKYLKNFRLEYDLNNFKINMISCDAYSNDTIVYKQYKYQLGYFYFPFFKNLENIIDFEFELNDNINFNNYINNFLDLINEEKYELITNYVMKIFINLIILNGDKNTNLIISHSNFIVLLISKIIYTTKQNFEEIVFIINRISSISKKAFDKIGKYDSNILYNIIFETTDSLSNLSNLTVDFIINNDLSDNTSLYLRNEYKNFKKNFNKYIFLTNLYLILKSMSFLLTPEKSIIKIAKLFSGLMKVYDKIDESMHKIRKISNESNDLNKTFLNILSHHIFMKKNGFCKKDY
jgi:hypothetical protein